MRTWQDEEFTTDFGTDDDRVADAVRLLEDGPGVAERVRAIERLGTLRARFDLVQRSTFSKSGRIRTAAAGALGSFPDEDLLALLTRLVDDPQYHVRAAAISSAGRGAVTTLFDRIMAKLSDDTEHGSVLCAALVAAARLAESDEQREQVAEFTNPFDGGLGYRDSSIAALGVLGDAESVAELRQLCDDALDSGGLPERLAAQLVRSLARHYDPDLDQARFLAMAENLSGGRSEATKVLAKHASEESRILFERALCDQNKKAVEVGIQGLTQLGVVPSLAHIHANLMRSNVQRPYMVLRFLSDHPPASGLLADLVGTGPKALRSLALRHLAIADPGRARQIAVSEVDSPDPMLRQEARRILDHADETTPASHSGLRVWVAGQGPEADALSEALRRRGHQATGEFHDDCQMVIVFDPATPLGVETSVTVVDATAIAGMLSGADVKAFSVPSPRVFGNLNLGLGRPFAPVCGDDPVRVRQVEDLLAGLGCLPVVVGDSTEAPHVAALGRYSQLLADGLDDPSDRLLGVIGRF